MKPVLTNLRLSSLLTSRFSLLFLLLISGCVERKFLIRTQPTGALVYVDGAEQGRAPLDLPFAHYGARRFEAELPEYHRTEKMVKVSPPYYQIFPFDFFFECLLPFHWIHEVPISMTLTPRTKSDEKDREALRERARQFKERAMPSGSGYEPR